MRNILYVVLALVVLAVASCGKTEVQNPNELAVRAAKVYYDYLIAGNYEAYVDGFYRPTASPAAIANS